MKQLIYISIVLFLVSLTSCFGGKPLVAAKADNNQTFDVDYLFEHDGCKVYRFYDHGSYVYFTNCTGDVTAVKTDSTKSKRVTIVKSDLK